MNSVSAGSKTGSYVCSSIPHIIKRCNFVKLHRLTKSGNGELKVEIRLIRAPRETGVGESIMFILLLLMCLTFGS